MTERWLVPEVLQSSAADCGPGVLLALLRGFGVDVDYERVRRACRTEVDGTSIDQLEDLLVELGVDAEQTIVPADLVFAPGAPTLPAIVVTQAHDGLAHFVLAWRRDCGVVQVMDPGRGRRWVGREAMTEELFIHRVTVEARTCGRWSRAPCLVAPLVKRLRALGATRSQAANLVAAAVRHPDVASVVALDAAARLVTSMREAGLDIARGRGGFACVRRLWPTAIADFGATTPTVPRSMWCAWPTGDGDVALTGAVLLRVPGSSRKRSGIDADDVRRRRPELFAPTPPGVERRLLDAMQQDGRALPWLWLSLSALVGGAATVETFALARLVDVAASLGTGWHRAAALTAIATLALALLALALPLRSLLAGVGRRLETRLRMDVLARLGAASDHFFTSRRASDVGERLHSLHVLREIPELLGFVAQRCATLAVTTVALLVVAPQAAVAIVALASAAVAVPWLGQRAMRERDLRMRRLHAGMTSKYFDALLGAEPLRTHNARGALQREYEWAMRDWRVAGRSFLRTALLLETLLGVVVLSIAAGIVVSWLLEPRALGDTLLVMYWTISLPWVARDLLGAAQRYPGYRSVALRLFDPGAEPALESSPPRRAATRRYGVGGGLSLRLEGIEVRAGSRALLEDIDLELAAGEHVAIVGPSGAGKSTLLALLLGFQPPSRGRIHADGDEVDEAALRRLRREIAWVDPAVGMWNTTVLDNLSYGATEATPRRVAEVIEASALRDVVARLPFGLQTGVGAGGTVLSGGEGQRLRFGRALMRAEARLVLLDEPFRGLELAMQRQLLERARARWQRATLLCVTHDIESALRFDRVVVIEHGRLIEDGPPRVLAADPRSRLGTLLEVDRRLRRTAWADTQWRRVVLERGRMGEDGTHG